jgi:hypothetical protein
MTCVPLRTVGNGVAVVSAEGAEVREDAGGAVRMEVDNAALSCASEAKWNLYISERCLGAVISVLCCLPQISAGLAFFDQS